jgi:hypothetical protein
LGDDAQVIDSKFLNNSGAGLTTGKSALIEHCTFAGNGTNGLFATDSGAVVIESVASNNATAGFRTGGGASLSGNVASDDVAAGFEDLVGGSTFEGNTGSSSTFGHGFLGPIKSAAGPIQGNNAFMGNSAVGNKFEGFGDAGGSTFEANTADNNGEGFFSRQGSTFVNNTADGNVDFGFDVICPVNLIGNTAQDNGIAPFTSGGGTTSGCNLQINLGF